MTMKNFSLSKRLALLGACVLMSAPAFAQSPSADEIMVAMDHSYRSAFTTALVNVQLMTCRYVVKNEAMSCRENPRVSVLEAVEKKWGEDLKDSRSITMVQQPASDRGVSMLAYEYFDGDRENDVLLYLPALGKARRIVSGSAGNEDGGSFFGTEFFVDDTQLRKIDQYTYRLIGEDEYEGRPVWVVESTPNERRASKTQYGKTHVWVDQERKLIVREDIYNKSGRMYRQRLNSEFVQVDGVWVARRQTMNNLQTRRISIVKNLSVAYDREVPDELLTERSLTDITFRDRELAALRDRAR